MNRFLPIAGVLLLFLFLESCAPLKLAVKPEAQIPALNLCVDYGPDLHPAIRDEMEAALDSFLLDYQAKGYPAYIRRCGRIPEAPNLYINVEDGGGLVGRQEQVMGVVVSVVGLFAVPYFMIQSELPIYVWFAYIPRNVSHAAVSLSGDLARYPNMTIIRDVSNTAMFRSPSKQVERQGEKFYMFLWELVGEMGMTRKN